MDFHLHLHLLFVFVFIHHTMRYRFALCITHTRVSAALRPLSYLTFDAWVSIVVCIDADCFI